MDTILVTGAAGFIGSNFVRHVLSHTEAFVVALDKLTYAGHLENLASLKGLDRFLFIKADICDRDAVTDALQRFRPVWLVNFAAESHVDRSIDDPRSFLDSNVVGAWELLEASRRYVLSAALGDRRLFRFLQVSTDEVYGSAGDGEAFCETSPYCPNSPYAATKASADHLVHAYHVTYGLPTLVTNCSNNYGPYQHPEKLIPLMIFNGLEGRSLPIYGDGGNVRDWLHVEDHCEGIVSALRRGALGGRYHLGGNTERTNLDVVDLLCDLLEERRPAKANPALVARGVSSYRQLKTFVEDRPGHDRRYAIDARKARKDLEWTPRHSFAEGLARTVDWYLDNPAWRAVVTASGEDRTRRGLSERTKGLL